MGTLRFMERKWGDERQNVGTHDAARSAAKVIPEANFRFIELAAFRLPTNFPTSLTGTESTGHLDLIPLPVPVDRVWCQRCEYQRKKRHAATCVLVFDPPTMLRSHSTSFTHSPFFQLMSTQASLLDPACCWTTTDCEGKMWQRTHSMISTRPKKLLPRSISLSLPLFRFSQFLPFSLSSPSSSTPSLTDDNGMDRPGQPNSTRALSFGRTYQRVVRSVLFSQLNAGDDKQPVRPQ
ncbi:hypothetical protein SODALDRAFT_358495 [Sodiomyces alkalinus F11]|uniref:Uncharacterized protein n=1 Tax=Sodiomyces alkalinus (strain CBS 110278 / VKM F-3762 / F11) TaxID=1314773 RepID=A0A3N2PZX2_SODAK|nr:hypothetical protein SODALDRAFT_358495 [Sodiomyces alkalinus F11]ROT40070.1 hypothetical protein SODALDRAFT_358495 [Sodiomyces alkalinus F11]